MFLLADLFFGIIGWIYLFIRYGRNNREVADREYLGNYSAAGRILFLQFFTSILILLMICMLLAILIRAITHPSEIKNY